VSGGFRSRGRVILGLAATYVLVALGAHLLSRSLMFPRPPVTYDLTPEYARLTTPDGVTLAARYWPCPGARFTILYLHGNFEELGRIGGFASQCVAHGYAFFAFDYRGYGRSGGEPNEKNVCADTRLAYRYLVHTLKVPASRVVLFGYSLGGGPAVELGLHEPVAGVILESAFTSAYRVMTRWPLLPGDKFVNLAKVPRLRVPVLVLHGTADATIAPWHGEALYEAVTSRKMKLFIPGGEHGGLAETAGPVYWTTLQEFTDSL